MKLEEMKVCDVLKLPLFRKTVSDILNKLESESRDAQFKYGMLKRTPYDRLKERGVLRADKIPYLYEMVIDKKLTGYSSSERKLIGEIGDAAFYRTMSTLKKQEEKK